MFISLDTIPRFRDPFALGPTSCQLISRLWTMLKNALIHSCHPPQETRNTCTCFQEVPGATHLHMHQAHHAMVTKAHWLSFFSFHTRAVGGEVQQRYIPGLLSDFDPGCRIESLHLQVRATISVHFGVRSSCIYFFWS